MSFDSETLTFKAATYQNSRSPIQITDQTINLTKKPNGKYGVARDKILVKVATAALNPVDLVLYNSTYWWTSYFSSPHGVGADYSGTIVDIGEKVKTHTKFKVGDKISGLYPHFLKEGTFAEYILINDNVIDSEFDLSPEGLDSDVAGSWPLVFGTAYHMFKAASNINENSKILILGGATSVGRYCIQLAKNVHHVKEIVTTNSDVSESLVRELGADETINYKNYKSVLEPVLNSVKTSGKFDFIFDCCGSSDLFSSIDNILKPSSEKGAYLSIVGDSKYKYSEANAFNLLFSNIYMFKRLLWSSLGLSSYTYKYIVTGQGDGWITLGKDLIESGKLRVFVDSVYKFEDFTQAIDRLTTNRANGKVVVRISDD